MNKLLSDDQLQTFMRQHRPVPPPPAPDLEEQLMNAIACNSQATDFNQLNLAIAKPHRTKRLQSWYIPSTIVAGLLITLSSFHLLIYSKELANANLEFFLETNWNDVTGDPTSNPGSNNSQTDWMLQTSSIR